jgi:hypothetical protein
MISTLGRLSAIAAGDDVCGRTNRVGGSAKLR